MIEEIVAEQNQCPDQQHGTTRRQPDQPCQHDHAETDGPEYAQVDPAEPKRPYRAHHNCIEQDQPHAAGQQIACERPSIIAFRSVQERRHAREKDESWCAIVCDEARQEQRRISPGKIGRVEVQRIDVEEIPHMVERHKDDDKPSHPVDSWQPGPSRCRNARDFSGEARSRLVNRLGHGFLPSTGNTNLLQFHMSPRTCKAAKTCSFSAPLIRSFFSSMHSLHPTPASWTWPCGFAAVAAVLTDLSTMSGWGHFR